jgi:Phage integrase family
MRTDLGKCAVGTQLAPNPRDPLYFETSTTLPVDFHSFRRAFNTALAGAGVNVQQAMHLAGHSDANTHMRYVMRAPAMRTIPPEALPVLPVAVASIVTTVTIHGGMKLNPP